MLRLKPCNYPQFSVNHSYFTNRLISSTDGMCLCFYRAETRAVQSEFYSFKNDNFHLIWFLIFTQTKIVVHVRTASSKEQLRDSTAFFRIIMPKEVFHMTRLNYDSRLCYLENMSRGFRPVLIHTGLFSNRRWQTA